MNNELNEDSQTPQDELVDDSTNIDIEEDETSEGQEDNKNPDEKLVKLEETNKKLFARAKKAESDLKAFKKEGSIAEKQPLTTKEDDLLKVVDQRVREMLEEKELDALDVSDAIRKNVKAYAKSEGISIKQATGSDYFDFLKQKEDEAKKVEDATIGSKRSAPSRKSFDADNPPDCDVTTPEGLKIFEEWKAWIKTQ